MTTTTRICDRCGATEEHKPGAVVKLPTILTVSTKGFCGDDIDADLCPVCRAFVLEAIRKAIFQHQRAGILNLA